MFVLLPAANCEMIRQSDNQTRCHPETGMFEPLQCSRLPGEMDRDQRATALNCRCVDPSNGQIRVPNMRITDRDQAPDCNHRGRHTYNNVTTLYSYWYVAILTTSLSHKVGKGLSGGLSHPPPPILK